MRLCHVAGLALAMFWAAQAHADNFTFSFTGIPYYSSQPGTVSGEILGLSDNGTSSPTDVLLFSDPDGIAPGDLTQLGWFTLKGDPDSFTLANGIITAGDLSYFDRTTNRELLLRFNGLDILTDVINGDQTGGSGSFSPAPVDEPGSLAVLGMGLICVAAALPLGLKYGRIKK